MIYRECPELAWGDYEVLDLGDPAVLGLRSHVDGTTVITVHNLVDRPVDVVLDLPDDQRKLTDLLTSTTVEDGRAPFELAPYGCRWLRTVG